MIVQRYGSWGGEDFQLIHTSLVSCCHVIAIQALRNWLPTRKIKIGECGSEIASGDHVISHLMTCAICIKDQMGSKVISRRGHMISCAC